MSTANQNTISNTHDPLTQNPFANLKEKLGQIKSPESEEAIKQTRKTETTEPVYVRKLFEDGLSGVEIGKKLGCSGVTITGALRENKIYKPIELAAWGLWDREHVLKPVAPVMAIVTASAELMEQMSEVICSHGGSVQMIIKP